MVKYICVLTPPLPRGQESSLLFLIFTQWHTLIEFSEKCSTEKKGHETSSAIFTPVDIGYNISVPCALPSPGSV